MLAPLTFTGIAATIRSGIANGASAVAHILDSVASLTTAGAKLLSLRNAGVEKAAIDKGGNVLAPEYRPLAAASAVVKGNPADGATAVGVVLDAITALANASAKLVSIRSAGVEKAYFDKEGNLFIGSTQINAVSTGTLTAASGWTIYAQSVKKNSDGLVTIWLDLGAGATPIAFQGALLPAGYRPTQATFIPVHNITDGVTSNVGIEADGWIHPPNTANKRYHVVVSFYAA
jgi:hypothetical protein